MAAKALNAEQNKIALDIISDQRLLIFRRLENHPTYDDICYILCYHMSH